MYVLAVNAVKCELFTKISFLHISEVCTWSIEMSVTMVGSDGCHSLSDAFRDLCAKRLLRKHFIQLKPDTVTNANLYRILQKHM